MARDAKELRVTLEAIECTNSEGDSGHNLEVYGQLEARGMFNDDNGDLQPGFQQVLWSRGENEEFQVAPGTEIQVNKTAQFLVFDRDFLWLGGRVLEEDDSPNDDDLLGDGFRRI